MTTHYRYDDIRGQILHYEDGQLVDARAPTPAEESLGEALLRARKALNEIAKHSLSAPLPMTEADAYRLAACSMIRIANTALAEDEA